MDRMGEWGGREGRRKEADDPCMGERLGLDKAWWEGCVDEGVGTTRYSGRLTVVSKLRLVKVLREGRRVIMWRSIRVITLASSPGYEALVTFGSFCATPRSDQSVSCWCLYFFSLLFLYLKKRKKKKTPTHTKTQNQLVFTNWWINHTSSKSTLCYSLFFSKRKQSSKIKWMENLRYKVWGWKNDLQNLY